MRLLINEAERTNKSGTLLASHGILDLQKFDTVLNLLHEHIEIWFNQSMERVSGWYKRKVQAVTIVVAIVVTAALNVDSVAIAQQLAKDVTLRSAIVAQAEQAAAQAPPVAAVPGPAGATATPVEDTSARIRKLTDTVTDLNALGLPIGWPDPAKRHDAAWILLKVMGLLLTAGAASLGAPFWFDVLNKFMSVRSAGKAPEEAPKAPKQVPLPALPGQPQGMAPTAGPDHN